MKPEIILDNMNGISITLTDMDNAIVRFRRVGCILKVKRYSGGFDYKISSNTTWNVCEEYLDIIKLAMRLSAKFMVKIEEDNKLSSEALNVKAIPFKNIVKHRIYCDAKGNYFAYLGRGNVIRNYSERTSVIINAQGQTYVYANLDNYKNTIELASKNTVLDLCKYTIETRCNAKKFVKDTGVYIESKTLVRDDIGLCSLSLLV